MDVDRWQKVKDLFTEAVALETVERASFLDRACGEDDDLRARVERLLAADNREIPLLDRDLPQILAAALNSAETPTIDDLSPDDHLAIGMFEKRLGPYLLLREVGRGGMAIVYAAVRDDEQYRRQVAIKLIRQGMDSEPILARFRQERQILANLDHPNIARLYDGGVTEGGLPYLVMELIDGEPIDRYCARHALPLDARLRLFLTVCDAVRYAHQNLVVHRDLKPSNLLVTADGVPKLLDFGIAKLLEPTEHDPFLAATVAGQRPMTPEYASPEQILGQPINTASDVYALGILLYRLLAHRGPYRLRSPAGRREIERAICEQEPVSPSVAAATPEFGGPPAADLGRWQRQLRGDLDNIVLKALQKAPERRYGSAGELAEDLRRFLSGLPVRARRATLFYRTSKFVRRHRLGVMAACLVILSLLAGIVATSWQARLASAERLTAQRVSGFLIDLFEVTHPGEGLGADVTALELLDRGARQITHGLEDRPEIQASLLDSMGLAYFKLGAWHEAEPLFERAYALRQDLGRDSDLATSLNHLGELRTAQARFDEAEQLHREALMRRRRRLGNEHPQVAESESNLAVALFYQNRFEEAETLARHALERQRRTLGEAHGDIASSLNNLALILKTRGRLAEAVPLYREALVMTRQVHGENHPDVAIHLVNLAQSLRQQGEPQEARDLYERALQLERTVLGEHHPALVDTMNNLAGCLIDLGEKEQAEALAREGLALGRQVFGDEAPAIARSSSLLARLAFERRDLEEAEELYRNALTIHRRVHGDVHREVATLLGNLATVLESRGDSANAERLHREALAIYRQLSGSPEAVVSHLDQLASLLMRRGEPESAQAFYREALAELSKSPDASTLTSATIRRSLAASMVAADHLEEAEKTLHEALKLFQERLGDEHREIAITRVELGEVLLALDRGADAEFELRASLTIWHQLGPSGARGRALTESALGACLTLLKRYDEAAELLQASLETLRASFGADHPRTQEAQRRWQALQAARKNQRS